MPRKVTMTALSPPGGPTPQKLQWCEECCGPCECYDPDAPAPELAGLALDGEALAVDFDSLTEEQQA